jgi:CO/xanthine dehydrogenase Mo-binding subunit
MGRSMSAIDENSPPPLFELSRRSFIRLAGAAAVLLVQYRLAAAAVPPAASGWSGGPGLARHRIEDVVKGRYDTQVVDTMFMEPEAGLAWLDGPRQTLHLVMGTQSTNGDLAGIAELFQAPDCPLPVRQIELNACYPGGGFGGRDMSALPLLLALAAAYAAPLGQRAVRLAYDRFEQFQAGLKQLESTATQRIALDSSGQLLAFESQLTLHTGGLENYSQHVARLAAYSGTGAYRVDCAAVDAVTRPTAGVLAGSMRGFGGTQPTLRSSR